MYVCICHSQLSRSVDVVTSAASSPPPWRGRQHYELRVLEPNPRSHNVSSWQRRESIAWQTRGCRRFSPPPGNGSIKHAHSYNNKMFKVAVIGVQKRYVFCYFLLTSYTIGPIKHDSHLANASTIKSVSLTLEQTQPSKVWPPHSEQIVWFSPTCGELIEKRFLPRSRIQLSIMWCDSLGFLLFCLPSTIISSIAASLFVWLLWCLY